MSRAREFFQEIIQKKKKPEAHWITIKVNFFQLFLCKVFSIHNY